MNEMVGGGIVFGQLRYENIRDGIWEIPLGVLCTEDGTRDKVEIENIPGFGITNLEYNRLKGTIRYVRNKYKPVWEMMSKGKNVNEWLAPIKKGSNKIRSFISGRGSRSYRNFTFEKIKPIKSLWKKLNIDMDEGFIKCCMMAWDTKEVDTEFRQFTFRWYQGMIHGNTVISHFGDVDRKCTFCKTTIENDRRTALGRNLTDIEREGLVIPDKDRPHIFWDCTTVRNCIQGIYQLYWG
jgi:hypothetical protein